MNETDLTNLRRRSELAGENKARNAAAQGEEFEAEAELLRRVLDAVRPALPALCRRVKQSETKTTGVIYLGTAGVMIAGLEPKAGASTESVWLMADGSLLLLSSVAFDGGWKSTTEDVDVDTVATMFVVEAIVGHLSHLVDAQLAGKLDRRTAEAEKHASKLRAICRLLEG